MKSKEITQLKDEDRNFLLSKTPHVLPDNPSDKGFTATQIKQKMYEGYVVLFEWLKRLQSETNDTIEEIKDYTDVERVIALIDSLNDTKLDRTGYEEDFDTPFYLQCKEFSVETAASNTPALKIDEIGNFFAHPENKFEVLLNDCGTFSVVNDCEMDGVCAVAKFVMDREGNHNINALSYDVNAYKNISITAHDHDDEDDLDAGGQGGGKIDLKAVKNFNIFAGEKFKVDTTNRRKIEEFYKKRVLNEDGSVNNEASEMQEVQIDIGEQTYTATEKIVFEAIGQSKPKLNSNKELQYDSNGNVTNYYTSQGDITLKAARRNEFYTYDGAEGFNSSITSYFKMYDKKIEIYAEKDILLKDDTILYTRKKVRVLDEDDIGSRVPSLSGGTIPSSYLPSYVDDVLEYDNLSSFPTRGATGKIYTAKDTNKIYRWSGSAYVEISASLALGETSSTAYAGDKGKKNAEDILDLQNNKVGILTPGKSATVYGHDANNTNVRLFTAANGDYSYTLIYRDKNAKAKIGTPTKTELGFIANVDYVNSAIDEIRDVTLFDGYPTFDEDETQDYFGIILDRSFTDFKEIKVYITIAIGSQRVQKEFSFYDMDFVNEIGEMHTSGILNYQGISIDFTLDMITSNNCVFISKTTTNTTTATVNLERVAIVGKH